MTYSSTARRGAAVIAAVAAVTLATRLGLRVAGGETVLGALSYLSQYFTILTNALTMIVMAWIALGRDVSARGVKAVVIAIVIVGLVYHTLLAHLVELSGLALLADHGTHSFVPLLACLWWVFLAPKPALRWSDLPLWVAWPTIYCAYILVRASGSGFYPYPFLNLPEIGWSGLAISIAGLLVAFIAVGLGLSMLNRLLDRS